MATNTSVNQNPINAVQDYLAQAIIATNALQASACADLCSLLQLASSEAERVRKAVKKAPAQVKAGKAAKPAAKVQGKQAGKAAAKVSAAAPKRSKKAVTVNGAAH